jgi:hypothetical protein
MAFMRITENGITRAKPDGMKMRRRVRMKAVKLIGITKAGRVIQGDRPPVDLVSLDQAQEQRLQPDHECHLCRPPLHDTQRQHEIESKQVCKRQGHRHDRTVENQLRFTRYKLHGTEA